MAKNRVEHSVLSLFSGCGGMDIGFEGDFTCLLRSVNPEMHFDWIAEKEGRFAKLVPTGFKTIFANDIRPDAKRAWTDYFKERPDEIYRLGSIVDFVKREKSGEDIFPKDVDIVTGGFPCQDFSIAGKRNGFNSKKSHNGHVLEIGEPSIESRGQLYMWMRDVISFVKPKMFIAENVKGLTNLADAKLVIEHDFAEAGDGGYIVIPARVLHAADYGVPQNRERVLFYGFRKTALKDEALKALSSKEIPALFDPYPKRTHRFTSVTADLFSLDEGPLAPPVTCREAFYGLGEPELTDDPAQRSLSRCKYMGKHCQGQTEVKNDSIGPTIRAEHHGNIEFRRLSSEHGGQHSDELAKGLKERRLTVRECARIQTFPDSYRFILPREDGKPSVSVSDAYKIIGNAVPCVLAFNVAMRLAENWSVYFKEE